MAVSGCSKVNQEVSEEEERVKKSYLVKRKTGRNSSSQEKKMSEYTSQCGAVKRTKTHARDGKLRRKTLQPDKREIEMRKISIGVKRVDTEEEMSFTNQTNL